MFHQRIAHKIWLGYFIPLAVLLVAGVLVPSALSAILSRATREYQVSSEFVDKVEALERAAMFSQNYLRGYVLIGDDDSRTQFQTSVHEYRALRRDVEERARRLRRAQLLQAVLANIHEDYETWLTTIARPQILRRSEARSGDLARRGQPLFRRIRSRLNRLHGIATRQRDQRMEHSLAAERIRRIMTIVGPGLALLLALLIGRSISLGVTRPLEALNRATEALEKGHSSRLLELEAAPDDEIGDLQRSFERMARTIGQREAILRAQNETLGALNRRVEAVLNATNDGILMFNRGGGISVFNEKAAALFGVDADVVMDQTFEQAGPLLFARFQKPHDVRDHLRALLSDPEAVTDTNYELVEPQWRVLRVYSAPVRGETDSGQGSGDVLGRIVVLRDITREATVDRMKTEFISVVSHELRTPLTAIKGYVDLILGGQTGPLGDLQREFLGIVQNSTTRLSALINDMLDISRIESGRVEVRREPVDYAKVARDAASVLANQAEEKRIELSLNIAPDLPHVSGDSDRISQILINLLSNAIKYTPHGGSVTVKIEAGQTFVTTCIADTGIGITPEDQQRLFQKFFRADNSTTREAGGTGLGLAITRALVEKLNGVIWVESEVGKGSRFYFTLPTVADSTRPAAPDSTQEIASPSSPPVGPQGELAAPLADREAPRTARPSGLIMCVDDDPAIVTLLTHQLGKRGFGTVGATSGAEALRRARDLKPDAITLDLMMPGIDGFTVLRKLKADPQTRAIPVVLVSALSGDGSRHELSDAFAFLRKPVEEAHLTDTLQAALASWRQPPTVLVAGDDCLAASLREHLKGKNDAARVLVAASRDEAEKQVAETPPDLVVVDVAATDGDAAGIIAALRAHPATAGAHFLMVTDEEILGDGVVEVAPLGTGPVGIDHLADLVGKLLTKHESTIPPPPPPVDGHAEQRRRSTNGDREE